jgi:hypothetical protein
LAELLLNSAENQLWELWKKIHLQQYLKKYFPKTGFPTFAKYIERHKKATTPTVFKILCLKERK